MRHSFRLAFLLLALPALMAGRQVTGSGTAAFFDSTAHSDAIRLTMTDVSAPSGGTEYVAWLGHDDDVQFTKLGTVSVNAGNGSLTYKDPSGSNLLAQNKKFLITQEPSPFSGSLPTLFSIVWADSLHPTGVPGADAAVTRLRNCLSTFSNTADNLGLAVWLKEQIPDYLSHAELAKNGALNNNGGEAQTHCDHVYDFILGRLINVNHGSIANNDDPVGYGFRRYGDPGTKDSSQGGAGYLGGAGYYVKLIIEDPQATTQMKASGWSALQALLNVFGATNDSGWAREVTIRAANIINGVYVVNGTLPAEGIPFYNLAERTINGTVSATDTASTTGGIRQAYFHMQQMATFALSAPEAVLTMSASSIDFGSILVDSVKVDSLIVRNTGNNLLLIDSVRATGQWFSVDPISGSLSPSDGMQFRVTYAPGETGMHAGFVLFYHSSSSGVDSVSLSGTATPLTDVRTAPVDGPPVSFSLGPNFPNPFNGGTAIPFSLPTASRVRMVVFDSMGREIALLAGGIEFPSGSHLIRWSATHLASGVYFLRIEATSPAEFFVQTRTILYLK